MGGNFGPVTWWSWDKRTKPRWWPYIKVEVQLWRLNIEIEV